MANLGVCAIDEYYMNKFFSHVKNERLYAIARKDSILKQVCHVAIGERKKKLVQFFMCFHMLVEGRLVIDFESMNKVLHSLMSTTFQNPLVKHKWLGDGILHA